MNLPTLRPPFLTGFICGVACVLVVYFAGQVRGSFLSNKVVRTEATQADRARICTLLNFGNSHYNLTRFEYRWSHGAGDSGGACAFAVRRTPDSPPWEAILAKWTSARGIPPLKETALIPGAVEQWHPHYKHRATTEPLVYTRNVTCVSSRADPGKEHVSFTWSTECQARFDDDTLRNELWFISRYVVFDQRVTIQ